MPTFSFPYHEVIDQYPDSSQKIKFGKGYEFASTPVGPDQLVFILKFPAMWWYESAGAVDYATNPERNMGAFVQFYESVRCAGWFDYVHPRRGAMICRFNKPLVTPRIFPNANGLTEPFEVELIQQPVLDSTNQYLCEETVALTDAFTTAANTARKALIDKTIRNLKTKGLWKKIDFLYVHAAQTEQAGRVNWKNPGPNHILTVVGVPTFTTNRGFTGTNSAVQDQLVGLNIKAAANYQQDNCFFANWVLNNVQSAYAVQGTNNSLYLIPRNASNQALWRVNTATSVTVTGVTDGSGLHLLVRDGAAAQRLYKNNVQIGTDSSIASVDSVATFRVLGNTTAESTGAQTGLSATGAALTATEATNFYNIMREYMVAVGAVT